jgi:NADH:ubiquinone oxidoreductase subunit 5 (subunit L)/multisubunit Na+/H+ antiporter MnhA subunit
LAAMFGSGLTLASFVKLLYSMFWGDRPKGLERVTESSWTMLVPLIILAFLCLAFGIYYLWPVSVLISPILSEAGIQAVIPGIWQSSLATVLLILSLIVGFLFYLGGRARGAVETEVFLGGEALDPEVYRVPGTQFYGPIKDLAGLKQLYERGERGAFDLYRYMVGGITWGARVLYQYIDQALNDLYREVLPALLDLIGQILRVFNTRLLLTYALWAAYAAGIVVALWLPGEELLLNATRILAIVGMLGWGLLALVETNLRRFLVFAASSHFGFVLLGATISWTAALAHLVSASVAFVAIFLCCGSISRTLRTSEIEAMDGLAERMPGRFLVFLIAALWLSGLPPFGSFFSKYLLGVAAHEVNLFFSLAITAAAILTLGYFLRPLRRFLHTAD